MIVPAKVHLLSKYTYSESWEGKAPQHSFLGAVAPLAPLPMFHVYFVISLAILYFLVQSWYAFLNIILARDKWCNIKAMILQ